MWEVDTALKESTTYEQIGPHQWRASITGMVRASALAANPVDCEMRLNRAVDIVLSQGLRGVGPFTFEGDGATARLAPQMEKLLTAGAAKVAVSAMQKNSTRSTTLKLARNSRKSSTDR